ncbi:putative 4-hydroxybenzoate polyprenyltransferase [Desulfohalobiaceae bacterium Ax17]|jgi:4-hydroxybenzoate polyprenyltransferase|uniref:4-hydroxybenzoate octaprenyltransferase n=1 Tax=Desulfovulcanus ferrireducens TaxID=2831190 RepID=UPI00207BA6DD|nr:4-hydroxybenzoate octaprenyltransferase [Desulfovulcanus ferrireducens]MBT8763276.1 putative 4-hydroxybenzoate polyprenyltransferase [Desulfovulcanus ferrireducens]
MFKDIFKKTVILARMVKIEHSVFALPFAYIGLFWAAGGWPGLAKFLALTLAMVAVRSFAMAFNRLADLKFDAQNERTRTRPLVTGEISIKATLVFIFFCALIFVGSCALLNRLCLYLSPIALAWSAFYSYSKRFTWLCHYILGSVLGLAPIAGWIAYRPEFNMTPLLVALGVLFWVAGFDILYAIQDVDFDKSRNLRSIPARFGIEAAFGYSAFSHVNTVIFFALAGLAYGAQWIYFVAWGVVSLILVVEHLIISPDDLSRINISFFTLNGLVSMVLFAGVLGDLFFKI